MPLDVRRQTRPFVVAAIYLPIGQGGRCPAARADNLGARNGHERVRDASPTTSPPLSLNMMILWSARSTRRRPAPGNSIVRAGGEFDAFQGDGAGIDRAVHAVQIAVKKNGGIDLVGKTFVGPNLRGVRAIEADFDPALVVGGGEKNVVVGRFSPPAEGERFAQGFLGKMLFSGDEALKKDPCSLGRGTDLGAVLSRMMLHRRQCPHHG